MKKKVIDFIKENSMIKNGDKVLVALSGGPDSVCLLHILSELRELLHIEVYAAHVNHCLRGESALKDEAYVEELCKNLNIKCFVKRVDINKISEEQNISTEMAGREERYKFFEELKNEYSLDKIAIAHNANDQAETLIMRALRGTGIEGLVGIKPVRDGIFIRPILILRRKEIEEYCEINNLNPRIDETNLEEIYSRNKIRLKAIPFIEENFNPDIVTTLNRLAYSCSKDVEFIQEEVEKRFPKLCIKENHSILIKEEAFNEKEALLTRIIKKALFEVSSKHNNFELKHIQDIIALKDKGTGKQINITNGVIAVNEYGEIRIKLVDSKKAKENKVLNLENIKSDDIKNYIINHEEIHPELTKEQEKAIEYAHRYCGAAADEEFGLKFNTKYRDFNCDGGDCANFASQIMYESGKFKKNAIWNYENGSATKAWVNAQGFKNYIVNSGRGSYISKGSYEEVYREAYNLRPGDFVGYEKKGRITHVSTVTGFDSKGYPLVTCHNTDRLLVPWDLGWSDKAIRFHFIKVNY